MRIFVLKVTHAPHVAAIYAYEHSRRYLSDYLRGRASNVSSIGGPESSGSLLGKRPVVVAPLAQNPRPLAAASASTALADGSVPARAKEADVSHSALGIRWVDDDLKELVIKLINQNEGLSATVAKVAVQIEEISSSVHQQQHPAESTH